MAVKTTRTVCVTCHARCGAIVHSEDGKIVKVEGDAQQRRLLRVGAFPTRDTQQHRGAHPVPHEALRLGP